MAKDAGGGGEFATACGLYIGRIGELGKPLIFRGISN